MAEVPLDSQVSSRSNLGHPNFYELERESRLQLQTGTACAANWFDTNHEHVLHAAIGTEVSEQVETLLLFVQWYIKEGRYSRALNLASKAVRVCRIACRPSLLRRALNLLGVANARIGNVTQATIDYVEGLEIADRLGDRIGKAAILANLSVSRFEVGLIADSMHLNRYVVELTAGEPHLAELASSAHHNIAAAALLLEDEKTALEEIELALEIAPDPANQFWAHNRLVFEVTFCKVLLKCGRVAEARRHAGVAERLASRLHSRPAQLRVSLAHSLCDVAEGAPARGLDRLERIRDWLPPEDPAYRDLLETTAQCAESAGRGAEAERIREKLLAHLASFQRRASIRQIAAFQRSIRTLGATHDHDLLELPSDARKSLSSSCSTGERATRLRHRLEALASLADQRESEGGSGHSLRVGQLVELLAIELGYESRRAAILGLAARLHDIGKLATPDVLLLKRAKLSRKEVAIIRRHTVEGCQMLTDILSTMENSNYPARETESIRMAGQIALHHHEWWNGCGYPRQLHGNAIPEEARITAIADVFEDLTGSKPYGPQLAAAQALQEIQQLSGHQFEPRLCNALARLVDSQRPGCVFEAIAKNQDEGSPYQRANRVIKRIIELARAGRGPETLEELLSVDPNPRKKLE